MAATDTTNAAYPEGTTYRIERRSRPPEGYRHDVCITTPDYELRVPRGVLGYCTEEQLRDIAHDLFLTAFETPIGGTGSRTIRAEFKDRTVALSFRGERCSVGEERDLIYSLMDAAVAVHWYELGHADSTPPEREGVSHARV